MKRIKLHLAKMMVCCILIVTTMLNMTALQGNAATKLKLNWSDNQVFYMLPTNYKDVTFQTELKSGGDPTDLTCTSDNFSVATIDNNGLITFHDGGSANITVTSQGKTVKQKLQVLNRTDWTKVVTVSNQSRIAVKNNVCTIKVTNQMDFPVKMSFKYDTYNKYNTKIESNLQNEAIYLAAKATVAYKKIVPESINYISIVDATFDYNQYGSKKIDTKKVTVKETDTVSKTSKKVRVIKEVIYNKNKSDIIIPYQVYFYDKNNKLSSISYKYEVVPANKKISVKFTYSPKGIQENAVKKVVYKFYTPLPVF